MAWSFLLLAAVLLGAGVVLTGAAVIVMAWALLYGHHPYEVLIGAEGVERLPQTGEPRMGQRGVTSRRRR